MGKPQHVQFRKLLVAGLAANCLGLGSFSVSASTQSLSLVPLPTELKIQQGILDVNGGFEATMQGCIHPIANAALKRFEDDFQILSGSFGNRKSLTITCRETDNALLTLDAAESYQLNVNAEGVDIEADGETGVLRALATLRQLVSRNADGVVLPVVTINDSPRFAWRGLMLDTSRHFVTVETLKRQIDAMELAKLNVLHLHLSDNEGFRLQSIAYPLLTEKGADGEFYTQQEMRDLIEYAADRGVRVVPEFDIPGHSMAILKAYPELAVAPIDPKDPLAKPKSALNPASEKTYSFLTTLLGEFAELFPDPQFHIGGDEVSHAAWDHSEEVQAFMKANSLGSKSEMEAYFHQRVRRILAKHGKTTVGWDEIADSPLPDDVIVQAWRTSNPVSTATAKGNRVIVSAGLYLNNLESAETHYAIDLLDPMAYSTMNDELLALTRKNPITAAQVSDGLVMKEVPALNDVQKSLVIGGEGALWAEVVNDELVDSRLWPRAFALAERFWSPASTTDSDDFYQRMVPAMEQLRTLGLADQTIRRRMLARLAPNDVNILQHFLNAVAPTRHMSNHIEAMMGMKPKLIELTDAASTDALVARRFKGDVIAYLAGDLSRASKIANELSLWETNHEAFKHIATGNPHLEKAVPTSADLAELGKIGRMSLSHLQSGTSLSASEYTNAMKHILKLEGYEAASASYLSIRSMKQPPGALIILTTGDVKKLLVAASHKSDI